MFWGDRNEFSQSILIEILTIKNSLFFIFESGLVPRYVESDSLGFIIAISCHNKIAVKEPNISEVLNLLLSCGGNSCYLVPTDGNKAALKH